MNNVPQVPTKETEGLTSSCSIGKSAFDNNNEARWMCLCRTERVVVARHSVCGGWNFTESSSSWVFRLRNCSISFFGSSENGTQHTATWRWWIIRQTTRKSVKVVEKSDFSCCAFDSSFSLPEWRIRLWGILHSVWRTWPIVLRREVFNFAFNHCCLDGSMSKSEEV